MMIAIYIGSDKLDLFADENIEVVSSISDSSDITKNITDYSKSFTVPASDRNNAIFKHYYNADVDNTFDSRLKVDGKIELDGLPYKIGKFRLDKVIVKKSKASSYSLNFFGQLVSFKDVVKDDELSSLDFTALNHLYSSNNVIAGLQNGLFDKKIIYTMLSQRRYYYNSDPTDVTNTDTTANIATVGAMWNDLKPSIKLIEIIKAIETKYDLVFSRDFFGREEFDRIYMWLNNSIIGAYQSKQLINFNSGGGLGFDLPTDTWVNFANNNPISPLNQQFRWQIAITPASGFEDVPYKIVVENNGIVINEFEVEGGAFQSGNAWVRNGAFSYQFFVSTNDTFSYTSELIMQRLYRAPGATFSTVTSASVVASVNTILYTFKPSQNMPKIKIIDFMRALFQMFKLLVIQKNSTDIYVNTLVDYYSQGRLIDITSFVDFESYDVNRGDILNEINFNFEPPTTLLNMQFKLNTGIAYGDEVTKLADENGQLLDGQKFEVKLPFEQIVYERLTDSNDGILTNIMYGLSTDRELKPVNPKPHVFYNNVVTMLGGKNLKIINTLGSIQTLSGNVNTASHTLNFFQPQFSTTFSEEFNEWDGSLISNNLYTNYYKDYIESLFNIKRRNFKFKSFLPLNILTSLSLNDVLKIKENYYRIDNFTLNLLTTEGTLNLINSFDNTINPFSAGQTIIFSDARQTTQTAYVKGNDSFTVTINDEGFGTGWISSIINDRLITFELEINTTGFDRSVTIEIDNGIKIITLILVQNFGVVTFDNVDITFDNILITWDNG